MVANDLFKRREDGGPDELYWEEADEIFDLTKDELNKNYKKVCNCSTVLDLQTNSLKDNYWIIQFIYIHSHAAHAMETCI